MNNDVLRAYKTADDVLRMLMTASGYATQAHELRSLATFGDDPQDMERDVLQTRARLAQRLADLNSLDSDIRSVSERLGDHWQRLQTIREFAYSDAGPYVIGELLTAVIPFVRRWIRETCSWLELGKKFPVHLPPKSGLVCNATADGFPLSIETMQVFHDRLLRERSILLKNNHVADSDPFSFGRMKRRWLDENSDLLDKQFELIRTKNPDRVLDAGGAGRGPWQFRKSLCREYGLNCPEFSESLP
jgi:hypothetical protein